MTRKMCKCLKLQLFRCIANEKIYRLLGIDGKSTTNRSIHIQPTIVCHKRSAFYINKRTYLLFQKITTDICKYRDVNHTFSYIKRNVHTLCLVREHKMQSSTSSKEQIGIYLITMRRVYFKTSKVVIANSHRITCIDLTTITIH